MKFVRVQSVYPLNVTKTQAISTSREELSFAPRDDLRLCRIQQLCENKRPSTKTITKGSELMLIKWDGQENRPDFIKGVRGPAWSTTVKSSITSNPSIVTFHTDTLPLIKMRLDFLFSVLSCLVNLTLAGKTNPNNPSSNGKNLTSLITGEQVSRTCTSAYMVTNIAIGKLNWGKRLKSR